MVKTLRYLSKSISEGSLSRHIPYFAERIPGVSYYQVHMGIKDYGKATTGRVLPFEKFCKEIGLV